MFDYLLKLTSAPLFLKPSKHFINTVHHYDLADHNIV